jgi:hypothetical protein
VCNCGHARIVHRGPLSEGCPGACGVRAAPHLGRTDCPCPAFELFATDEGKDSGWLRDRLRCKRCGTVHLDACPDGVTP